MRLSVCLVALLLIRMGDALAAPSVLVWSTANNDGNTSAIAAWLQDSGQFSNVVGIDQNATMSLAQLEGYDEVLYFSNHNQSQNPIAIGNVLADYADTGRRLVLATFSWARQTTNTLGGRIITDEISPLIPMNINSAYSDVSMSSNDGSGYFSDVIALSGYYHDKVVLTSGATQRAVWSDGFPLLATKGNVVAVNLFPDDSFGHVGGDYRQLFVNALAVPEPATWITSVMGGMLLWLGLVRARRRRCCA